MAGGDTALLVGGAAVVILGVALGRFAPTVALVVTLLLVPLRVPLWPSVYPATLFFCGAALGRSREIATVLAEERAFLLATMGLPIWIFLSGVWARQPMFLFGLLGKWLMVVGAAWFAAADRTPSPRPLVLGSVASIVPHALWGFAERVHVIAPLGADDALHMRGISWYGDVRGRALFWHPNRLGEFLEQAGILLAAAGVSAVLPWVCLIGVAAAAAGVWGTGSMGSLAALGGGSTLAAGWLVARRYGLGAGARARRVRGATVVVAAAAAAALVGTYAFVSHGGIGSRKMVYRYALELIERRPWVGFGGGNWSLLVGEAPIELSRFWFLGHAHSLPLHVWVELGVVGVALLVAFFAVPLWSGMRRLSRAPAQWYGVGVGAALAVAALFAHNFVHYFLRDPVDGIMTGLLLGTVVAVARRASPEAK